MTEEVLKLQLFPSGSFVRTGGPLPSPVYGRASDVRAYSEQTLEPDAFVTCNPWRPDEERRSVKLIDEVESHSAGELIAEYRQHDVRVVTDGDMQSYVESLLAVQQGIERHKTDVIILPFRGSWFPFQFLNAMSNVPFVHVPIPFTGGANGNQIDEVRAELACRLSKVAANVGRDQLHVVVLDAAISGHSAVAMARVLDRIESPRMRVAFHLLHAGEAPRELRRQNVLRGSGRHVLSVQYYQVTNLIVEDWDPAIGLGLEFEGGTVGMKPCVEKGRVIVDTRGRDGSGGVQVLESPDLAGMVTDLVANHFQEYVETSSEYKLNAVVWDLLERK